MSTSQRRQRGLARPNSRLQRKRRRASNTSTPMATQTETIELEENADEEVVDLTCESASDAVVVDLTHNDSVVFVGEARLKMIYQEKSLFLRHQRQPDTGLRNEQKTLSSQSTMQGEGPLEVTTGETISVSILLICLERRRRRRRNRTTQGPDSCVLSSGDEDSEGDVCVASTFSAYLNKLKDGTASPRPPGTVTCPICMDVHTEIIQSGRVIVATKCGHVFCSQCLRDAMKNSSTCPTCRKKLTHKQYHPIYI
ncbi:E3 ubiquitin-protein ligase RNF4 [Pleurodeles waltl]|uniref:E3 ubiquitin-protein ligase RNF4 n=1 Tax=Pleurodeles waltl TaxID=8319 RepID=UPI003709BA93